MPTTTTKTIIITVVSEINVFKCECCIVCCCCWFNYSNKRYWWIYFCPTIVIVTNLRTNLFFPPTNKIVFCCCFSRIKFEFDVQKQQQRKKKSNEFDWYLFKVQKIFNANFMQSFFTVVASIVNNDHYTVVEFASFSFYRFDNPNYQSIANNDNDNGNQNFKIKYKRWMTNTGMAI